MVARITSEEIVRGDLDYICRQLGNELPSIAGKRIAITGGAGFLGYYLVQAILRWNEISTSAPTAVYVYDNFSRGTPKWLSDIKEDSNLTLVKHDITMPLPKDFGPFEYIIHAASIASPIYYRQHPIETMDANVNGLRSLLDWTFEQMDTSAPVEGFLYFSTSEIYGDP